MLSRRGIAPLFLDLFSFMFAPIRFPTYPTWYCPSPLPLRSSISPGSLNVLFTWIPQSAKPRIRLALRIECLEDRSVPSVAMAYDPLTIAVGFRTGDPSDPVVARELPLAADQTLEQALATWRQNPDVAFAEPNYTYGATLVRPNDPHFGVQYALDNAGQSGGTPDADMDAPEAWDLAIGGTRAVVAVIDTGIDYTHPDLYLNIWLNQAEIPVAVRSLLADVDGDGLITFWDLNNPVNVGVGKITDLNANGRIDGGDVLRSASQGGWADGVDAGANGYLDDLIGWDFVGDDNNPMDRTAEDGGHGTHVAGTIGAIGNNGVGVAGVAWRVQLMAVRFLGLEGGTSVAAASAIRYSAANGAAVSNNSWGGPAPSQAIHDAIAFARARGQIFVTAAGNEAANNDVTPSYPANFALDNIVSVAATDQNDRLVDFSNYGRGTVDLGAPGEDIASTYPGGRYVYMTGTSMATPQVAGVFALLLNREPSLTYSTAISRVLGTVDPVPTLSATTVSGGRVNVYRALAASPAAPVAPPLAPLPSAPGSVRPSAVLAVGVEPGVLSQAWLLAHTGQMRLRVDPFPGFGGGVNVASGDVNGDGTPDLVVGAGAGAPGGHVKVFNGATGVLLHSFFAYLGFGGGVNVAAGDVDGDGFADILTGAGAGAPGGHVKVFSGRTGVEFRSFFAYGAGFLGGASVAAGYLDGDKFADIVTGSGAGAPSGHVKVFNGASGSELASYLAYLGFNGGVRVASGDLDGDGRAEVITGTFAAAPHVKVFDAAGAERASFHAFDPSRMTAVDVAATDVNGDGRADVVAAARFGTVPRLRTFRGPDLAEIGNAFTLGDLLGGIEVG